MTVTNRNDHKRLTRMDLRPFECGPPAAVVQLCVTLLKPEPRLAEMFIRLGGPRVELRLAAIDSRVFGIRESPASQSPTA